MSLKDRILREMVVEPLAIEIFNELPSEVKTKEKLDEIQAKLNEEKVKKQ
ncbi:unnamed protein product [marine sediment metagenome]|uniref:Uncharacterized protein n=1 Tax=marine sediment metagenome TaxID=412755 RepID=X1E3P0_9ZZZZ